MHCDFCGGHENLKAFGDEIIQAPSMKFAKYQRNIGHLDLYDHKTFKM